MPDGSASWSDGQVAAALALIGSSLVGPGAAESIRVRRWCSPPSSLSLWVAFPLIGLIPVLLTVGARAGWRTRSALTGLTLGLVVSLLTSVIVLVAYVFGLAGA